MIGARPVLLILFLLAGSLSPPALFGQAPKARPPGSQTEQGFSLEQNYPNPVSSGTWIPFRLEESLFENSDSVVVSLRIYNILRQIKAIPVLAEGSRPTRQQIINLTFDRPGRKLAYWDGRDAAGLRVPSQVYYYELTVNGRTRTDKLVVLR